MTSLFSRLQKLNTRCLFGHDWRIRTYVSPPQPLSENCSGDHWYVGKQCARCNRWRAFRAGLAFVRRDIKPVMDALRDVL